MSEPSPQTQTPPADYVPHYLDWDGCVNVRDVGGLSTRDGRRIRTGALIRSDSLQKLTAAGLATARGAGISRVIDLRRPAESTANPHPFADDAAYVNVPVQDPADPDHEWLELAQIYIAMLDLRPTFFANAVAAVADAPEGAVVVHCAGGKDRTGIVTALCLAVAGVEPEPIAADYALSEERLRASDAAQMEAITDPDRRAAATRLRLTPASNMLTVLDHLQQRYGGVEAYLREGGVTDSQFDALRRRLVTD
jgi:protein tyrosine/serine phosphatase